MTIPSFLSLPALLSSHAGVAASDLCEARPPSLHPGHPHPLHTDRPLWILGKEFLRCGCPGYLWCCVPLHGSVLREREMWFN